VFFFSSRRRHTRWPRDWSSAVCSSDLKKMRSRVTASTVARLDRFGRLSWPKLSRRATVLAVTLLLIFFGAAGGGSLYLRGPGGGVGRGWGRARGAGGGGRVVGRRGGVG